MPSIETTILSPASSPGVSRSASVGRASSSAEVDEPEDELPWNPLEWPEEEPPKPPPTIAPTAKPAMASTANVPRASRLRRALALSMAPMLAALGGSPSPRAARIRPAS